MNNENRRIAPLKDVNVAVMLAMILGPFGTVYASIGAGIGFMVGAIVLYLIMFFVGLDTGVASNEMFIAYGFAAGYWILNVAVAWKMARDHNDRFVE